MVNGSKKFPVYIYISYLREHPVIKSVFIPEYFSESEFSDGVEIKKRCKEEAEMISNIITINRFGKNIPFSKILSKNKFSSINENKVSQYKLVSTAFDGEVVFSFNDAGILQKFDTSVAKLNEHQLLFVLKHLPKNVTFINKLNGVKYQNGLINLKNKLT
jgi:hypothetical protein